MKKAMNAAYIVIIDYAHGKDERMAH